MKIDINCDLGEGFGAWRLGDDEALLRIVSSANVACGFHAGDPTIMDRTVRCAKASRVDVGAHVSFPDLQGFGRRVMQLEPKELEALTLYQLGALYGIARAAQHPMTHMSFHGALGNMSFVDAALADTLVKAVRAFDRSLIVIAPPMTELESAALRAGLPVARVVFADRAYDDRGLLVPRRQPGAVIEDPDAVGERVVRMLQDRAITSTSGKRLPVQIDSVLVHGDTPGAATLAALVRDRIEASGAVVAPVYPVMA
jgi:5-oxoprolinase (ATP-hydrolysing) subunit A